MRLLLQRGKKLLAKLLVVYSFGSQLFAITAVTPTIAQVPVVKDAKQTKKVKKQSKKEDMLSKIKQNLRFYQKMALAHKNAKIAAESKAKNYLAGLKKARTISGRHKLINLRHKAILSMRAHAHKLSMYSAKAVAISETIIKMKKAKKVLVGRASWYGGAWAGRRTATGERFNPGDLTAAMRGFQGHKARVINLTNKKSVIVRINDHGPASWTGRVIDLSHKSFSKIASTRQGVIPKVKIYVY